LATQKTVAKIMNELGIAGISPRAFVVKTTIAQSQGVYPRDRVKRAFTPPRVNMIWTSDITYKCSVRDEYSGRVVGWAIADHMRDDLVIAALKMAHMTRAEHTKGIIFHTDQGSQFNSGAVRKQCHVMGLKRPWERRGVVSTTRPRNRIGVDLTPIF